MNHVSIGMTAPDFTGNTTMGPFTLSSHKGKWIVLFSHPGDYTPVCTTEFIAFTKAYPSFQQLGADLVGLSIDSNPSHLAWVNSINQITKLTVPFPIIADRDGSIARLYGMIAPDASTQETVRNVYIIDPEQKIRCILIYPLTTGRYIPEIIRIIEALQVNDKYKVVTPANWQPGDPALVPPPKTYQDLKDRGQNAQKMGLDCLEWYLCFKKLPSTRE